MRNERTVFLFKEIARGFTDYANEIGFPALAGEVYCDDFYQGNPLVNAMVVGILKKSNQVKAKAEGVGNLVLITLTLPSARKKCLVLPTKALPFTLAMKNGPGAVKIRSIVITSKTLLSLRNPSR